MTSLILLLFTGLTYYVVIHYILTRQLDKDLQVEEQEITEHIRLSQRLPLPGYYKDQQVEFKLLKRGQNVKREFVNKDYYDVKEKEWEPGRSLLSSVNNKNNRYLVTITKSRVEAEELIQIIFIITLALSFLLLVSVTLINRFILKQIWKPFYSILGQMKTFNITDKKGISAYKTRIDEFKELNSAVINMSSRVKVDYADLKMFTDNASHEMMTPIAVINSKLDTLLQTGSFTDSQGEVMEEIYTAVGRLTRLNHSLLLLAKIENHLIRDSETLNVKELVTQKLKQFQELIDGKAISVSYNLMEKEIVISKYLSDVLLNNLVGNAIRHNKEKGLIEIILDEEKLSIINTGEEAILNAEKAFERFYKGAKSDGLGLGLAISKQICSGYGLKLDYFYKDDKHTFTISFPSSEVKGLFS
jgi:signal transduction histidine kinase